MVVRALARHLDTLGLVTLEEATEHGDCFYETMPSSPDSAVTLRSSGGATSSVGLHLGYDEPQVGIDVRGVSSVAAFDRAVSIYHALVGLHDDVLDPGGEAVEVIRIDSLTSAPAHMAVDEQGRHVYTFTIALHVRAGSTYRS